MTTRNSNVAIDIYEAARRQARTKSAQGMAPPKPPAPATTPAAPKPPAPVSPPRGRGFPNPNVTPGPQQPPAAPGFAAMSPAAQQKQQQLGQAQQMYQQPPTVFGRMAQGSGMVSTALQNLGLRGAGVGSYLASAGGKIDKWMGAPTTAPKPLTPAEQQEYRAIQSAVSHGERPLTHTERFRLARYEQQSKRYNAEQARQNYSDAFSAAAVNNADRAFGTARQVTEMLDRGETGNEARVRSVQGPGGEQRAEITTEHPIAQLKRELNQEAGYDNANSTLGQISNVAYGVGNAAAQSAPTALATAGVGALGGAALRAGGATQAATAVGNALNPSLRTLLPHNTARIGAGLGAGVGAALSANEIANAGTGAEQIQAGENAFGRTLGLAAAGALPGQMFFPAAGAVATNAATQAVPAATTTLGAAGRVAGQAAAGMAAPVALGAVNAATAGADRNEVARQQVIADEARYPTWDRMRDDAMGDYGFGEAAIAGSVAQLEQMQAAGATPEQLKPKMEELVQRHTKGMSPEQHAQFKNDVGAYFAQPTTPDGQPTPAAQKVVSGAQEKAVAEFDRSTPTAADPKTYGEQQAQRASIFEQVQNMPPAAQAALYIGLPLALVGMFMGGGEDGGGLGGLLMGALGLGVAGAGLAGAGMFGQGAQNSVVDALSSLGQSAGIVPKQLTPEQKAILTAQDPIQAAMASGGGNLTREQAAQRVKDVRSHMAQLKLLNRLGSAQGRLFENMGLSPEEAAQAQKNVGTLTGAYENPNSQLNQHLQNAEWYADPNKSGLMGRAVEMVGTQNAQNLKNLWGRLTKRGSSMNIAQQIWLQQQTIKAARCWAGYEPVPGKAPYSNDSCRPKGSKKPQKKTTEKTSGEAPVKPVSGPKMPQDWVDSFKRRVQTGNKAMGQLTGKKAAEECCATGTLPKHDAGEPTKQVSIKKVETDHDETVVTGSLGQDQKKST